MAKAKIFSKNSLYVAPSTLWAAMQSGKGNNSHNFHNLSPNDIYTALILLTKPDAIYKSLRMNNRYIIVTAALYQGKINIVMVIEKDASASWNRKAFINKLVTIYPKDKVSEQNMNYSTKNKRETNGAPIAFPGLSTYIVLVYFSKAMTQTKLIFVY